MEKVGRIFLVTGVVLLLFFSLLPDGLYAQGAGRIMGRVTDANTGENLPGANIVLEGTYLGASSNRFGFYRIDNVPYGTYTLKVIYIGYEEFTTQVSVTQDAPIVEQNVELKESAIRAEEVEVVGYLQGQMKALSQQMSAPNITNVVSREEMDRFPDMNTAEALQRLPGVNMQRSLGEGRFIYIRGTEPRMTTVTVDGEPIASPQDEERFVGLDVINASQLSEIQVVKALTPDMDGDAIGGTVNLVTQSAFDREGQSIKVDLGSGYSQLPAEPLYRGAINYSNIFGAKRNFGITLNANWYRNNIGSHSDEMDWTNQEDVNGNPLPFALSDLRFYNYQTRRDHYGLSSTLEYKPNKYHRLYIRGMYNQRNDDQTRNMIRYRISKGDYLNSTTVSKARLAYEMQDRNEIQRISSVIGGGESQFGKLNLNYRVSYSYASETKKNPGQIKSEFQLNQKVNLLLNFEDPDFPQVDITNLDNGYQYDPANWEIDNQSFRETFTSNKKFLTSVDARVPYQFFYFPAQIKFGGKVKLEKKDRDSQRWKYKWKGSEDIFMNRFASGKRIDNFLQDHYIFAPIMDPDKFFPFFNQFRGQNDGLRESIKLDDSDGLGGKYSATEDIYASYIMTTIDMGKLQVLAGVRDEYTKTTYDGMELLYDDNGDFLSANPVSNKSSYNNIFPDIHFRYRVTPRTNFRVSVTTGISRPNYFDLAPYQWVFPENRQILQGNPKLEPTTSISYDIMVEHYFKGIGILSGGFFYKSLDKVSYHRFFRQEGGAFDGFLVEQPVNGGTAKLYGIEVNLMQQLSFLPGFLSGFGIFGNYTYVKSEADLQFRERSVLPGQAGDVGNIGLSYEKYGLTARLSLNYNGKILDRVGETADFDRYVDDHLQLDFSASYRVITGLDVYLQMVNITNEPQREYWGIKSRPRLNEYYSWWMRGGLKVSL